MKRGVLRLFSACLLLGIALCLTIGALSASAGRERVCLRLAVQLPEPGAWLRLCRPDGTPLQMLTADAGGQAVSELLEPGDYLAVTDYGRAVVRLEQTGLRVRSGCAAVCGGRLTFDTVSRGTVIVQRSETEQAGTEYLLRGGDYEARIRPETGQTSCRFESVPYGVYTLYEDAAARATVIVGAGSPEVTLLLVPGK